MSLNNPPIVFLKGRSIFVYLPNFVQKGNNALRRWFKVIVGVPRIQLFGTLLFGGAIFFFVFSLYAFLFSFPPQSAAAKGLLVSAPITSPGVPLFPLEIHIANNGLVLLRSTKVMAINGTTITVSTAWGSTNLKWIVFTNGSVYGTHVFGTRFFNRDGQKFSLQDIHVGDFVTVTGTLDTTTKEPTLHADSVRNLEE